MVLVQRSVLPDSFDAIMAETSFDPSRVRDVLYRQPWLTAHVRSNLYRDQRPHLVADNGDALYNCIDLITAAIPTFRQNVNDKVWPRLLIVIEGNESTNPFINHLRQNWNNVSLHDGQGTILTDL